MRKGSPCDLVPIALLTLTASVTLSLDSITPLSNSQLLPPLSHPCTPPLPSLPLDASQLPLSSLKMATEADDSATVRPLPPLLASRKLTCSSRPAPQDHQRGSSPSLPFLPNRLQADQMSTNRSTRSGRRTRPSSTTWSSPTPSTGLPSLASGCPTARGTSHSFFPRVTATERPGGDARKYFGDGRS
jgi:hypothetical protein